MKNSRISVDPKVMHGQPVIKGTRISVELVLHHLADGYSVDEIIAEYPQLTKRDIKAALLYAAKAVSGNAAKPKR